MNNFDCAMSHKKEHNDAEKKKLIVELIGKAQSGNDEAFFELREIYEPLIEGRVSKNTLYGMTAQDIDDLRSEALVQFCRAVLNFDFATKGVEFGLYAKICIENGLISFIRSYKRKNENSVLALDGEIGSTATHNDFMQDIIERENLSSLVGLIQESLSDYESRVWWLYVSGISVAEIAERLDASDTKSVSNAIYRIRKKLRSRISGEK